MKKPAFKLAAAFALIVFFCISAVGCFGAPQEGKAPAKDPAQAKYIGFAFYVLPVEHNLNFPVNVDYYIGNFRYYFDDSSNTPVPCEDLKEITITFCKAAENAAPNDKPSENPSAAPNDKPSESPAEIPIEDGKLRQDGEIFEKVIIKLDDDDKPTVSYTDGAGKTLDETDESNPPKYICKLDKKTAYITVRCAEMRRGDSFKVTAKLADGRATGDDDSNTCTLAVVAQTANLMDMVLLGMGAYLLFLAVRGRGKLYTAEFIKEGMEKKHRLTIRLSCLISALCLISSGITAIFDGCGKYVIVKQILFYTAVGVFVIAIIITSLMTDKKARREAQQKQLQGRSAADHSSAFVFDDDEPTIDDIRNVKK